MLSPNEAAAFERGQLFKRHIRAAAALNELYDDSAIADAVGRRRAAVGNWWVGAKPDPEALLRLADVTGFALAELTRFVYRGRSAADPAGRGVSRGGQRPRRHE